MNAIEGGKTMELLIKNARLRGRDGTWDVAITDGVIEKIERGIGDKAADTIDAEEKLVTESFVNPHIHTCKVYTLMMMDEEALKDYHGEGMGKAMTAIELASRVKAKYDEKWILPNVRKSFKLAVRYGTTHLRAFADVDSKAKLEGVKALLKARDEFKGILDVQVVGADVVGGIPWIEFTEQDEWEHIDRMFEIAKTYNKDVSMLVDDAGDPGLRTLEKLALATLREGWEGRVLAQHARAMSQYPEPYLMKLIALLKKAKLGVVSDPLTGPLHARVREMIEEGALVALAQDDISDAYYPYGRNNMLEVAFINSHLLWMTTRGDMEKLYDMITTDAARSIGINDFGLEKGCVANIVVLHEENVLEALRNHREPRYLVSHGKRVDLSKMVGNEEDL
jgi:cytosine deaminase